MDTTYTRPWWGDFELDIGETFSLSIGKLQLQGQRQAHEWRLSTYYDHNLSWQHQGWAHDQGKTLPPLPADAETLRFPFTETSTPLRLTPAPADRPLITQPVEPIHLPPGESVRLFVSVPLWIRVQVGPTPTMLHEFPIRRPSNTWFGPSTIEGSLCYATRTRGRLSLADVPIRAHRAVTEIHIRNEADDILLLDCLNIPVIYLSLYSTPDAMLWTEAVTMTRTRNANQAALNVSKRISGNIDAAQATRVCKPRQALPQNRVIRAFEALLKQVGGAD